MKRRIMVEMLQYCGFAVKLLQFVAKSDKRVEVNGYSLADLIRKAAWKMPFFRGEFTDFERTEFVQGYVPALGYFFSDDFKGCFQDFIYLIDRVICSGFGSVYQVLQIEVFFYRVHVFLFLDNMKRPQNKSDKRPDKDG